MDGYGETPSFYIWPKGHEEGEPFPDDFFIRVRDALDAAGFESESAA